MPLAAGQPRRAGAEFMEEPQSGRIFADGAQGTELVNTDVLASQGEQRIAQSAKLKRNTPERIFRGAPKFWRIINRAKLGYVQVWSDSFHGELYPEGATEDKRTWLQPGEEMIIPMDAGLHFFGNIFDPRCPDALSIIARTGGFVLEGQTLASLRTPPRIIGGPIGLPDFIIEPLDGRNRLVGQPVAIYELYDRATKKLRVLPTNTDPELKKLEETTLLNRIREYHLEEQDLPLYDARGNPVDAAKGCDCSPIPHDRGVAGCVHAVARGAVIGEQRHESEDPGEGEEAEEEESPPEDEPEATGTASRGRGRPRRE